MAKNSQVDWLGADVLLKVARVNDDALAGIAFRIEGEAKVGAPVDTGFHRNAIYSVTRGGPHGVPPTGGTLVDRKGQRVARAAVPPINDLPDGVGAAVHAAAEYAIWVELHQPHILPAAERVAKRVAGTITAAARNRLK